MQIIYLTLPLALMIFGVLWYMHIIRIICGKSKPLPAFIGIALFFVPLLLILIPFFLTSGAHAGLIVTLTIISVILSTMLFTTGAIKHLDGKAIIIFLAMNIGFYGMLCLAG